MARKLKKKQIKEILIKVLLFFVLVLFLGNLGEATWGGEKASEIKRNYLKLLAVQEVEGVYKGKIADLYLELKEGSGRVFLETFPLTKIDTQISTRFAKEIACDYFDLDCEKYDFIYTIKAESNIIGGPSAGAAIAALTAVTLMDLDYDEEVTVTGTINSGGIIGPVGGIREKLEAAADNNLKKVLIALGSGSLKKGNQTLDLIAEAKEKKGLTVFEVGDLNEILFHLTGKKLKEEAVLKIDEGYQSLMKELSDLLCERTEKLEKELEKLKKSGLKKGEELKEIQEKKEKAEKSREKKEYYAAASFCFGANVLIKEKIYQEKKVGLGWMVRRIEELRKKALSLETSLESKKITTLSDLQTLMVVRDRLNEVKRRGEKFKEEENKFYALAYLEERLFSAKAWTYFFKMKGKAFDFEKEKLKESCQQKIAESEERYQYIALLFGESLVKSIKEQLEESLKSLEKNDYVLCLIKGIQAKAEANAVLSSLGLNEEGFESLLENKIKAVERIIAENSLVEVFPILGYSYYQYALSLKKENKESALLYLEYALELSKLDIYFGGKEKEKEETKPFFWLSREIKKDKIGSLVIFFSGSLVGVFVTLFVLFVRKKKEKKKVRNKKLMKKQKKKRRK